MPIKILIMGLPGAGKTTLAKLLGKKIKSIWLNADKIRKEFNDWDFSPEGRVRQATRMRNLADEEIKNGNNVIADFICPTKKTRENFNADYVVWVNTIKTGRFDDTNSMFEKPLSFDLEISSKDAEYWSKKIVKDLNNKFTKIDKTCI
ncbi:MAG: adenylyl-sulfate kinase [Cellvibrionales bacterium TMED122]|nr:MAG: adenylyl-sulfate kinase [Cellvibrionales bacterium TMED122]|tara:strand:- start:679 stop:1122 length:444 start_codon:yes stop_codon:yes gene_type:complete